jgi:hypothetical protein
MRFPVVRERVRVSGRSGTFLVLSVDRARGVADLVSIPRKGPVEENVPLSSIRPLVDGASESSDKQRSSD